MDCATPVGWTRVDAASVAASVTSRPHGHVPLPHLSVPTLVSSRVQANILPTPACSCHVHRTPSLLPKCEPTCQTAAAPAVLSTSAASSAQHPAVDTFRAQQTRRQPQKLLPLRCSCQDGWPPVTGAAGLGEACCRRPLLSRKDVDFHS